MTENEVREEFMNIYLGNRPQTTGTVLKVALELYGVLKQIEVLIAHSHTTELEKVIEIKSLLKRFSRRTEKIGAAGEKAGSGFPGDT